MTPTIMSIIMLAIIIAGIFLKKIPVPFLLMIVPIICALILGTNINDLSTMVINSLNNTMVSCGYMLLFGLLYFTMLQETGMFETLVEKFLSLTKGKINVYMVMVLTTILSIIGMLTATLVTGYLIVFPIMMPFYEKLKFDKKAAMIICQTALAAMCFLPWGIGISISAVFAGVDTMVLAKEVVPISLCFIPVIVLQWLYFAKRHKAQGGLMKIDLSQDMKSIETQSSESKDKPHLRPNRFWINLIVFIGSILAISVFSIPAYLVFIVSCLLTTIFNYPSPKEYQPLWAKGGQTFFNTLIMLAGISVFIGVFRETGMIDGLAELLVSIIPESLTRYMHIILLAICTIVIHYVPYQLYNSLYPIIVSVGANFGLTGAQVIAPYVTNVAFGTGSSTLTPTTHVGTGLLNIDTEEYCKLAVKVLTVSNLLVIAIGLVLGVIK